MLSLVSVEAVKFESVPIDPVKLRRKYSDREGKLVRCATKI